METRKAVGLFAVGVLILMPGAMFAGNKYDGNWTTTMACEQHGETAAYKWTFPSVIKDGVYHGQHGQQGGPGYLVVDGKIADDGSAKLVAKGTVEQNNAHGIFATKGNNYGYDIKAQFEATKGTGKRNEGAGILGRPCTFDFEKQADAGTQPDGASATPPAATN